MAVYDSRMSRTSRRQFAKTLTLLPLVATELAAKAPPVKATVKPTADLLALVERLRRFPLVNADEPDVTFSALTKRW
jgi:hypothetical protein